MKRRTIVQLAAVMLATPGRALAQARTYRLALLAVSSAAAAAHLHKALFGKLEELGYREGQNLVVDRRFAQGNFDSLPALAAELVALKPDVIVTGTAPPALAAFKATRTDQIPIVFTAVSDPVSLGIVKSLARPGTNATGVSAQIIELQAKRLQMLKETLPGASLVAVLHNPHNSQELPFLAALKDAAKTMRLELRIIEAAFEADFAPAFRSLDAERPNAFYVLDSPFAFLHRARIVALANGRRLPGFYGFADYADAGGLMSYSASSTEQFRAAATYIDKILKGAKPGDLPVEQPTKFELVINLKTARVLGLKIPQSILLRADRVIE